MSQETTENQQRPSVTQPWPDGAEIHHEPQPSLPSSSSSSSSLSVSAAVPAADNEVTERAVCWDLDQRGDVGETALHLALLLSIKQTKYREIALALLSAFPRLCLDYYEDDEYYGKYCSSSNQ